MSKVNVGMVTYGERSHVRHKSLEAFLEIDTVDKIHPVSNNASSPTPEQDRIEVTTLESNMGSAYGFKVGTKEALDSEAEYIWLLDDHNRVSSTTLDVLLENEAEASKDIDLVAVTARRPGRVVKPVRERAEDSCFPGF